MQHDPQIDIKKPLRPALQRKERLWFIALTSLTILAIMGHWFFSAHA